MLDLMSPVTGSSLLPIKTTTRLTEFDKIIINGVEYMWDSDVANDRIFVMAESNGRARKIDFDTVEAMLGIGDMVVIEGYYHARAVERRAVVGHDSVLAMNDRKLDEAIRKLKWVQLAMRAKAERKYGTLEDGEDLPYRILRDYQKTIAAAMKREGSRLQESNSKNKKGQDVLLGAAFDLSEISVMWGSGFLRVPATLKGLQGVSYWQWMKAKERLRLHDRQDYDLRADVIADAIEWAAEQSDVAVAQLELDAPVLKFATYEYEDGHMARFIRAIDTSSDRSAKIREQASLRPELAGLFGTQSPKAVEAAKAKSTRTAEEIAALRNEEARKAAREASAEDDDEFGIID